MRRRTFMVALASLAMGRRLLGQNPGVAPLEGALPPRSLDTPDLAVGLAMLDAAQLPAEDRPFARYVWQGPVPRKELAAAITFAFNTAISQSANIVRPVPLAGGRLLRWDLRTL